MIRGLKNPAWLGVLLGVAALAVAVITWQQGRINYTVAYTDAAELSTFRSGTPFVAIVNGTAVPLKELSTVKLKVWNSGNQTIDAAVLDPRLIVSVPRGRILDLRVVRHNLTSDPVVGVCKSNSCEITTGRLLPNMGIEMILLAQGVSGGDGARVSAAESSIVGFRENLNFGRRIDFSFWGLIVIPLMMVIRDLFETSDRRRAIAKGEAAPPSGHWINRLAESGKPVSGKVASFYIGLIGLLALLAAPCLFFYVLVIESKPPF